ncbi:hypothetical protein ACTOVQ_07100 [Arcanobacterium canis]
MGRLIAISHAQVRRRRPVTTGRPDQSWTAVPHHFRQPTSNALPHANDGAQPAHIEAVSGEESQNSFNDDCDTVKTTQPFPDYRRL